MDFEGPVPAAKRDTLSSTHVQILRDRHAAQYVARDDEIAVGDLAVFAEPGRDVHGIAEIGKLSLDAATLAHDHRSGMQSGTEAWDGIELVLVLGREACDLAIDRK